MKRTSFGVLLLLLITVAAVASYMTRSAKAQKNIRVFTAALLPSNEVAPVAVNPTEIFGVGNATVTIDTTANTYRFDWGMTGLASNSIVIPSHIHRGVSTANGPVVVDSGLTPAAPIPAVSGAFSATRTGLTATGGAALVSEIIGNPAGFYFNVHTALSTGGVARGQLTAQQTTTLTVPTLSEWGMILMFLLLAAVATYFIFGRSASLATAGGGQSFMSSAAPKLVDIRRLGKVTLYVEGVIVLGLILFSSWITPLDIGGAIVSGLIVAFIIHMMVVSKRR